MKEKRGNRTALELRLLRFVVECLFQGSSVGFVELGCDVVHGDTADRGVVENCELWRADAKL
jgi:hypothetical protein